MHLCRFLERAERRVTLTWLAGVLLGTLLAGEATAQPVASESGFVPGNTSGATSPALDGSANEPATTANEKDEPPAFGLMVDAGLPDGAMGSLGYRPLSWVRLQAGAGSNSISPGLRLGASLIPLGVGPSVTVEAGHYFEGNANQLARTLSGAGYEDTAVLDRIGYEFANAHLGLEFGGDHVVFFVHGGFSYVKTTIHNANDLLNQPSGSESTTTVSINQDPTVEAFVPSAKLGLAVFFL